MKRDVAVRRLGVVSCCCALLLGAAAEASANFHLWRFNELYSNADGTVQFIELRCPNANGEHQVSNHQLKSGTKTFNITTNLPSSTTANKFMIFATDDFAALPGAVTPDYIIPDGFFNPLGDTLNFASVDSWTFTSEQLPLDGLMSLLDAGGTAVNTPTNFAGMVGEIDLSTPDVPGDTDGNGTVDLEDLNNVRNNFGGAGPGIVGDTNDDELVDLEDLNAVRNNFGTGGSTSVPEPGTAALALAGLALLATARRR